MSKYKNINSTIIYYVLTITLDVSSIGTHTHLLALEIYYSIVRLYCLHPIVLGFILKNLSLGMSTSQFAGHLSKLEANAWAMLDTSQTKCDISLKYSASC